jgi:hypothetical protein
MKTLLKPLSLALFVAATLPTQSAYIRTSPPSDTIPATGPSPTSVRLSAERTMRGLLPHSDLRWRLRHRRLHQSFGAGGDDVYVVKLDANGNLQWTKTIGGPRVKRATPSFRPPMAATPSPATPTPSAQERWDVYVVKLDANGNLQWTKTIGGKKDDVGNSLIQTSDGGYAIAGYTTSFGAGEWDVYVVKLDANGNLQWTKTIGGPGDDGATPSFRPPMAATPSPATPILRRRRGMSMSSSWMPMETSNGPKPSADQAMK